MDRPQPVTPELAADLEGLRRLNRFSGSHRLVTRFLGRWWRPGETYTVLDLCTASADIPRLMVDWARARQIRLRVRAVDFQPGTVAIARARCAGYPEIKLVEADARTYVPPAGEGGNDFVFCSLALHHFGEADAVRVLQNCRRWARRAALVADLERSVALRWGIWWLTTFVVRAPMIRADARLSVRRAFTYPELGRLAREAGWEGFGQGRFWCGRQAVWLELPGPVGGP